MDDSNQLSKVALERAETLAELRLSKILWEGEDEQRCDSLLFEVLIEVKGLPPHLACAKLRSAMTKQQTIERITDYLPHLGEDVLQSVLTLLEHVQPDLDAWDRQVLADAESGRLDSLVDQALTNHQVGDSDDLFERIKARSEA